jgi:phenylalanyl-tRNA synthetase beta chain
MKISYDWLGEYADHGLSPDRLAETLTMGGLEVDEIETVGQSFKHVVVGRVEAVTEHPDADRLVLCSVDIGSDDRLQIACGAPNVAEDQLVPVAREGATVQVPDRDNPDEYVSLTVEPTTLRGEMSEGMICAEDELGLSDDHSGIMVLDEDATVGEPFADYLRARRLPPRDTIFNIDLTPNRPDAASHIGVARDAVALTDGELHRPEVSIPEEGSETAREVDVNIHDPAGCRRYVAMIVRDVSVGESPDWLKYRLKSIGLRPRNNIVDITNFVMHECGQPLHAFDLDRLSERSIVVRQTDREQSFTTLDGVERTLPAGTLAICDAREPIAIAGIMGGEHSEVTDHTTDVLIESAYFDPTIIRKTTKALQLNTDSSYRFERGVDPEQQAWAAARAADLLSKTADGEQISGMIDANPDPIPPTEISIRPERVNTVLGTSLSAEQIIEYLEAVGCATSRSAGKPVRCTAPSFRPDLTREIDLVEEIARLYGYNNIPERGRTQLPNTPPQEDSKRRLRAFLRSRLAGLGFREIYTNSMLRDEIASQFADDALLPFESQASIVETLNPISREMAALRPSLLPGMLDVMAHNHNHGLEELRFMEFGHVFRQTKNPDTTIPGYEEKRSLLLGLSGSAGRLTWDRDVEETDFFDLKGIVATVLRTLHLDNLESVSYSDPTTVSAYRLILQVDGEPVGVIARLQEDVAEQYDLTHAVLFAEFNLDRLFEYASPPWERTYQPVPRYPRVNRDIAVVVPRSQTAGELIRTIEREGGPLLQTVDVFDVYEGEHVPKASKSIGFTLQFGGDHTLVDEEVDEYVEAIVQALKREYEATLRQ